ncbi:DUF1236 domain-containing protein [Agrobacterium vitis]
MKTKIALIVAAALAGSIATSAMAQNATVTGAAGGAVTGAVVGGPVGAAVGGVVGAVAGTAIDPPPPRVVTYVRQQPMPAQPYVTDQQIVVGQHLPRQIVITPIPEDPTYAYAIVNNERVIVDPQSYMVIDIIQ